MLDEGEAEPQARRRRPNAGSRKRRSIRKAGSRKPMAFSSPAFLTGVGVSSGSAQCPKRHDLHVGLSRRCADAGVLIRVQRTAPCAGCVDFRCTESPAGLLRRRCSLGPAAHRAASGVLEGAPCPPFPISTGAAGDSNWFTAGNWSNGQVPYFSDTVERSRAARDHSGQHRQFCHG